ncbi:MAG: hypothetical protein ACFB21_04370, partial [Opitutales bacterium]
QIFVEAAQAFIDSLDQHDSMFLVTEECGWVWFQGEPVNYDHTRVDGLPRSQDAAYYKETTALYSITKEAQLKTGCRIGRKPLLYPIPLQYAVDVDTIEDFRQAERILNSQQTSA